MEAKSIYLFCFAPRESLPSIAGPGLDETSPLLRVIFKDVVAVVGEVNAEEWTGPTGERNLQDLNWVGPRVYHHEEIVERVMRHSPLFPSRFGTLFSSLRRLESLLANHYDEIVNFLNYMSDKEEWGVKALLDGSKAERAFLAAKLPPLSSTPGARYLLEQRLRAEAKRGVTSWTRQIGPDIARLLQEQAVGFRPRKVRTQPEGDREIAFNWAFLLRKDAREEFLNRAETLSAEHAEWGLSLETSGPWPPYTFCPTLSEA